MFNPNGADNATCYLGAEAADVAANCQGGAYASALSACHVERFM